MYYMPILASFYFLLPLVILSHCLSHTALYFHVLLPSVSMSYCLVFLCLSGLPPVSISYFLLCLCNTALCFYIIQPPVSILYCLLFLCHFALCFYVLLATEPGSGAARPDHIGLYSERLWSN